MKTIQYLIITSLILFIGSCTGCKNRDERSNSYKTKEKRDNETAAGKEIPKTSTERKIGKAIFYLENSESMCGYVNGYTQFVDVVSDLSEKPEFVDQGTLRQFFFVNGKDLKLNSLGDDPAILKTKLTDSEYKKYGDIKYSNLNSMFQMALRNAINDTITILISDAIYDVGKDSPESALVKEGKETRSEFISRLGVGDVQTIIIKFNSFFDGKYFPIKGGITPLKQERPYYVFIFGDTDLLNEYFSDEYIKNLKGYSDLARFLKWNEFSIPYQITNKEKKGTFRFDNRNKNKLVKASPVHDNFQFAFAVDFSELPFSNDFCLSKNNYSHIDNYLVDDIISLNEDKIPGIGFDATHLITLLSKGNPYGKISLRLNYSNPTWIQETNIDEEISIVGDTEHTFGFRFLTEAITEAYDYRNETKTIVDFNFEITKN